MRQNNGYIGIINKYDISFGLADFSLRSTIKDSRRSAQTTTHRKNPKHRIIQRNQN